MFMVWNTFRSPALADSKQRASGPLQACGSVPEEQGQIGCWVWGTDFTPSNCTPEVGRALPAAMVQHLGQVLPAAACSLLEVSLGPMDNTTKKHGNLHPYNVRQVWSAWGSWSQWHTYAPWGAVSSRKVSIVPSHCWQRSELKLPFHLL